MDYEIIKYLKYANLYNFELARQSKDIKKIINILMDSSQIFICGNGGSSSTASHFANDLQKICKLKVFSLTDNTPIVTAISNDISYDSIFVEQLKNLCKDNTVESIVLISGSGNSKNIIEAAKWGLKNHKEVITFIGMDGGEIKKMRDVLKIHINSDMLHSEDWHLLLCHLITTCIEVENEHQ